MPSKARSAETNRKVRTYQAIGVIPLIILIVTLATAGKQLTLRCTRLASGEVDCAVRKSILGVITVEEKTIAGVQSVAISQQCVDVNCNYRLELYGTQGLVPVNEKYSSNYDQLNEIENQFNNFFMDKSRSFVQMKEETKPIMIIAVVVVFLIIWAYLGYLIWQVRHPKTEDESAKD